VSDVIYWYAIGNLTPRPALLEGIPDSAEGSLDFEAGGWWVRERIWIGWFRRGWSQPRLVKPDIPPSPAAPSPVETTDSSTPKWPDCNPPADDWCGGCNMNGVHYKKTEISPGKWQWIVDVETENYARVQQDRRRNLYWALRSRVLTDEEMAEVGRYGDGLNIEPLQGYMPEEKMRELNDALLQQFKLRAAAAGVQK
jgi:hypothetical protein